MNTEKTRFRIKRGVSFTLLTGMLIGMMATQSFASGPIYAIDSDGNGSEPVALSGSQSSDPDGALIDFQWSIGGTPILSGYGPQVPNLVRVFPVGTTVVTLTVRDEVQVSSADVVSVIVLPQGANQPPVANATVPSNVTANISNVASLSVNASLSTDPDGDVINRYVWTEGTTSYYDGASAIATFNLTGLGLHTVRLRVYSTDNNSITQSGFKDFAVQVNPPSITLAGKDFTRSLSRDFTFDPPNQDFAGITFNPFTQTYFMTDNVSDKIFELQPNGDLIRTIDIATLHAVGVTTDAEGITWMHGITFALALHDGKQLAVVNIGPTTTVLVPGDAIVYNTPGGAGKPKGLSYSGSDDSFYMVSKDAPKTVTKLKINSVTGQLNSVWSKVVDNLPASDLADVTVFRRLSPGTDAMFLISESSQTVMEVDLSGPTAILKSACSLTGFNIPKAGALLFNQNGEMVIVGKHAAGVPQVDFSVFTPTTPILNKRPNALITQANLP